MIQLGIKHIIDFLISFVVLIILLPVFIVIALLIKLSSKGPVFFTAERVGKNNKIFKAYKFRTMVDNAINMGMGIETAENDPRITGVGKILRTFSLDELPQLINVLKGQMSLIGPRPALVHQVDQYTEEEKKRLVMRPGLTGWAQVNGRNLISWKERIKLDVWYINNWSLWFDLKVLFMTPKVVLSKEGLYGEGGVVKDYE
ncbi:MAG: sugar transferase [Candidatus Omnitrophota bacterium]|nr:MAG: sugar transferase [Candidatus Omnitrophota bacterium]